MKRLLLCVLFLMNQYAFCQDAVEEPQPVLHETVIGAEQASSMANSLALAEKVSLDFKDADIHAVLKILAQKANVNIVPTPDVMGTVSIKLFDVPWERALDIVLKSNGYGYQKQGNVILVTKIENIAKIQAEEPLRTEIMHLKFLDAQDAQRIIIPLLSPRGKVAILFARGQKGWQFGSFQIGKETKGAGSLKREEAGGKKEEVISIERNTAGGFTSSKIEYEPSVKSKTLLVTDTDESLDRIINQVLPRIDRKPKQVLIEAKIMEVNKDKLKDLGIDFGTGSTGAESTTFTHVAAERNGAGSITSTIAGHLLGSETTPSTFGPKATGITGISPYNTGLELVFRKLSGTEFEAIIHALEEDVRTNTLSAPRVLTMDNQEASMLVGYHTPILSAELDEDDSGQTSITQTLDYYQEIGIRLNVVPQVSEEGFINMIIHPSITSSASNISATTTVGSTTSTINYPVIDVREVQTQVLMRDGETVVIGGLLKDVKSTSVSGIPFLRKIPFIGKLFQRETVDTAKIDLLIFITARIITDEDFAPEQIAKLQDRLGFPEPVDKAAAKKAAREKKKK